MDADGSPVLAVAQTKDRIIAESIYIPDAMV